MIKKKLKLSQIKQKNHLNSVKPNSLNTIPSKYFQPNSSLPIDEEMAATPPTDPHQEQVIWQQLRQIELKLNDKLNSLPLCSNSPEVAAIYNPTEYASKLHLLYLERFLTTEKDILFIGMNPGPWGMCQTGIPFGNISSVRDWMHLWETVEKPPNELSARPVNGLQCERVEQSGLRFWGLFQEICPESEQFFHNCFVYNYCPLAFFHRSGRNITPAELKGPDKTNLQKICTESLIDAITLIKPKIIITIGRYTYDRTKTILKTDNFSTETPIKHLCMTHPSPRSLNNTNWKEETKIWLQENEIMPFLTYNKTNK